ncbi:hypothetical protein BGZ49_000204, partial [Haplosporangium sp. Z 27]
MANQVSHRVLVILAQVLFLWDQVQAQSTTNQTISAKPKSSGILAYKPSIPGNTIFGVLYLILSIIFFYNIFKRNDKWALCLPIGAIASSAGFFIRLTLDPENFQLTKFALQQLFVVVAPSAFLAFNYMLYGRFITAIDPKFGNDIKSTSKTEKSRFSFIPPLIVGRTFVISDITTFIIQCGAGGLQAIGSSATNYNLNLVNLGDHLFLAGVTIQGISYLLFTLLFTVAFFRLIKDRKKNYPDQLQKGWTGLDSQTLTIVGGLYFSSVFIIVRSVYRIVEFTQGYHGYLISHEVFLFVVDSGPLVLAIGIWAFVWPTILLDIIKTKTREGVEISSMEIGSSRVESNNNSKSEW